MTSRVKIAYALLSVLLALLLWFYVVGIQKPTKEEVLNGVVVTLKGEEELLENYSLTVTSNKKIAVDLTVQGNIVDVAALRSQQSEITAEADLSIVTTSGTHQLMYEITLPDKLSDSITILDRSPAYVPVKVEKVQTSPVDITLINEVTVADGYIADPVRLEPETLLVTGPEATVSRIVRAEAVWNRENVDRSISTDLDYTFYDRFGQEVSRTGLTVNYDYITASMEVFQLKDIPFTVKLEPGGGATEADVHVYFDPPSITVKGDSMALSGFTSIQLDTIALKDQVSRTGRYTREIQLPAGVENVSGETECTVTIEMDGLDTRTFTCENISVVGAPEGYTPVLTTKRLRVAIRGSSADLVTVNSSNIRVVADISDLTSTAYGAVSVPAEVFVDGHSNVGAIGEYKVALELMTDEEAAALLAPPPPETTPVPED